MSTAQQIYTRLRQAGMTPEGALGVLGNLQAESGLESCRLQGDFAADRAKSHAFAEQVDSGQLSADEASKKALGWGLAQWTFPSRLKALILHCMVRGVSIADLEAQVDFLILEMQQDWPDLWSFLCRTDSLEEAVAKVCTDFERPEIPKIAERIAAAETLRAQITDRPAPEAPDAPGDQTTEAGIRQMVCSCARSLVGRREADGSHKPIINLYNSIDPLPAGYRMTYEDPWCAAFVSAIGKACDLLDVILPECSCDRMIALYQKAGRWIENDAYIPKPGDLIFYDWQDSGQGDNRGSSDHVGLVIEAEGKLITVIEGNYQDSVARRYIYQDGQFIRGFASPDYASRAKPADPAPTPAPAAPKDEPIPAPEKEDLSMVPLPNLAPGAYSEAVRNLQRLLIARGYRCGGAYSFVYRQELPDGQFGPKTAEAVRTWQQESGLKVTGSVGPLDWAALIIT